MSKVNDFDTNIFIDSILLCIRSYIDNANMVRYSHVIRNERRAERLYIAICL